MRTSNTRKKATASNKTGEHTHTKNKTNEAEQATHYQTKYMTKGYQPHSAPSTTPMGENSVEKNRTK